jgi:hypothetical protein
MQDDDFKYVPCFCDSDKVCEVPDMRDAGLLHMEVLRHTHWYKVLAVLPCSHVSAPPDWQIPSTEHESGSGLQIWNQESSHRSLAFVIP